MFRMRAPGVEIAVMVGWFLIQCGGVIATVNFHNDVQEINLLRRVFQSQFDGWL